MGKYSPTVGEYFIVCKQLVSGGYVDRLDYS
jgi:hypothetical protein